MINEDLSTEQTILEAAEAEFLEKGYHNSKTVGIAKRAGVSHSMLHYYFRSKENLFQMIFRRKVQTLSQLFEGISEKRLPFRDTVRLLIEYQFNFIAQNPKLPLFVVNEIISKKENLEMLLKAVLPKIEELLGRIERAFDEEIDKGTVRPMPFRDFMMNIISMNASSFIFLSVMDNILPNADEKMKEMYLSERRESNVQFILKALQP